MSECSRSVFFIRIDHCFACGLVRNSIFTVDWPVSSSSTISYIVLAFITWSSHGLLPCCFPCWTSRTHRIWLNQTVFQNQPALGYAGRGHQTIFVVADFVERSIPGWTLQPTSGDPSCVDWFCGGFSPESLLVCPAHGPLSWSKSGFFWVESGSVVDSTNEMGRWRKQWSCSGDGFFDHLTMDVLPREE